MQRRIVPHDALERAISPAMRRRMRRIPSWALRSKAAIASRRSESNDGERTAIDGVVILGMHRSGTSLITRLVSLLGLAVCREEDLLVGRKGNPRGHWESKSLLAFNERLLAERGGAWFCPPSLDSEAASRMLRSHGVEARTRFDRAHPRRPWVWKDPRTCVLLPLWSAVLGGSAVYVLIVRHPLEVSDSLARRNGCTPAFGLALWERYTREAMLGAAGRPMMVCTYDEVLADPLAWSARLLSFLEQMGAALRPVDPAAARAFTMPGMRHSSEAWTDLRSRSSTISAEQRALVEAVSVSVTQASYAPPSLPPETPDTERIFEEIRLVLAGGNGHRRLSDLPSSLITRRSSKAPTGAPSPPPVSVVLPGGELSTEALITALIPSLPARSEIILVTGERSESTEVDSGVLLRRIAREGPPGEAGDAARGVEAANGRIVLLATASMIRCDQWYEPFKHALATLEVAAVGPVMRFGSRAERSYYGCAFDSEDLTRTFVGRPSSVTYPLAALLVGAHCAYDRKVLAAAGGIDGSFDSARAAAAELSLRLWRMGFPSRTIPEVELWSGGICEDDDRDGNGDGLYDRLRLASLHFDSARLRAFSERASHIASYGLAAERLASTDIEARRAAIDAVCAFSMDSYFDAFPLPQRV